MAEFLRLGRRSLATLTEHLSSNEYTWDKLSQLLFKHGLDARFLDARSSGQYKLGALGKVFHPLVEDGADQNETINARNLLEEITVTAFDEMSSEVSISLDIDIPTHTRTLYQSFQQALRADGLDLVEGRVVPFLSPSVDPAQEQGLLESRLNKYGFSVASNHLEQAVDNAVGCNWEAANGQVRSFLEALCNAIASKIWHETSSVPTRGEARKFLAKDGFLNPKESNLLKSLFTVLHGQGGHAGTSSSDDCHRRRLMAVAMANYYIDHLEEWEATQV